eukprot:GHVP01055516.1.p1 GENE.GHVP01055516.1~~GHVP01055516.1.p1  ORF type:complete len:195 (+),score=24.78 GHVP01055516.1:875-1459(+)
MNILIFSYLASLIYASIPNPTVVLKQENLKNGVQVGEEVPVSWYWYPAQEGVEYVYIGVYDESDTKYYALGKHKADRSAKFQISSSFPEAHKYRFIVWVDKRPKDMKKEGDGVSAHFYLHYPTITEDTTVHVLTKRTKTPNNSSDETEDDLSKDSTKKKVVPTYTPEETTNNGPVSFSFSLIVCILAGFLFIFY